MKNLVLDNVRNKHIVAQGLKHEGIGMYQLGVSSRKPNLSEANFVEKQKDEVNSVVIAKKLKLWYKRYDHLRYKGLNVSSKLCPH
jgi:hypothetical protein